MTRAGDGEAARIIRQEEGATGAVELILPQGVLRDLDVGVGAVRPIPPHRPAVELRAGVRREKALHDIGIGSARTA